MKRILRPLVALALLLAVPASFTSCQEDSPEVDYNMEVTMTNDFSKVVEAINSGALKDEAAIQELAKAIDKMNTDQATKLRAILDVLGDVNKTLETRLAAIAAAIESQTLLLKSKLAAIAEAIDKHMKKQSELVGMIAEAIDKLGGTLSDKLDQIKKEIYDPQKALQERIDLLLGAINSKTLTFAQKLDFIESATTSEINKDKPQDQFQILSTSLSELFTVAQASGEVAPDVLERLRALVNRAEELRGEIDNGLPPANAVVELLDMLQQLKAQANVPTPPTPPTPQPEGDYVDLGLPSGLKWATYDLGATKPEERGDFYAWGELEPNKNEFSWETYKHGKVVNGVIKFTKYCTDPDWGLDGFVDNKKKLDSEDDVAHVKLGAPWRMPTGDEANELAQACIWSKEVINGKVCFRGKSKYNGKSITFKASGKVNKSILEGDDESTIIWVSDELFQTPDQALTLHLFGTTAGSDVVIKANTTYQQRYLGISIRPVRP
jgi:hypothetical protein